VSGPAAVLDASIDWYARFLGRAPDARVGDEPVETYSAGERHVTVPDPDGNAIAFVESPALG
jgi:hypothetical protein